MDQKAKDAIYDVLLTGLGYFAFMSKYGIFNAVESHPSFDQVKTSFNGYKSINLPDGYLWEDFLPPGNPIDNIADWTASAADFLVDPDGYIELYFGNLITSEDWSNANQGVSENLSAWTKAIAESFNFCFIYDEVWPAVAWNYKTITGVNATYIPETIWLVKQQPPPPPGDSVVTEMLEVTGE